MIGGSLVEKLAFYAYGKIGHLVTARLRDRLRRKLYPPGAAKPKMLVVDIVGSCNLRCPSCAVGNMGIGVNPTGMMAEDLFTQTIVKAKRDHGVHVVALYNWTEPFLHPRLANFIEIVKAEKLVCAISTNLNLMRDIDAVLDAGLDIFRISLSGYTQANYGLTHARGDIEKVKENMRLLSEAIRRTGARPAVEVYYHKYLHNLEELEAMKAYVAELGFLWLESWAYYMPMEQVLKVIDGEPTAAENDFIDNRLALPIREAVAAAERLEGYDRCTLLEDQIVLDHRGNVNLCCTVYDFAANRLGTFLDMTEADLKAAKSSHKTCESCTSHGLQKYSTYFDIPELRDQYDALAQARVAARETRQEAYIL